MLLAALPTSAQPRSDDDRIDLVLMTLPFAINATPEQIAQVEAQAREAMSHVRRCEDLRSEVSTVPGATSGYVSVRVGDLRPNRQMYEQIPKLALGGVAGPFGVVEGFQIVAMCGPSRGQ
jgi:peptidyl-prolyl cis-trans isomerase SurA